MRPFAEAFYSSQAWRNCREAYMQKVSGLCELCLKEGRYTPAEAVHHIQPLNPGNINDPEISLNFDNLMAVCRECHARLHSRQGEAKAARRYRVDECGHVIIEE